MDKKPQLEPALPISTNCSAETKQNKASHLSVQWQKLKMQTGLRASTIRLLRNSVNEDMSNHAASDPMHFLRL
jgi:hypothetical protein